MRILFTCRPLAGHYDPLVGLARAAGGSHDVAFASAPSVVERARADGFAAFAVGPESMTRLVAHRLPARDVLATDAGRIFFFAEVFAALELEPRARDLDRLFATWRPDVVVHDVTELGAPLAATVARIPYATASFGPLPAQPVIRAAGQAAAPHWRARGLDADPYAGAYRHLYLDVSPPSLQLPWIAELPAVQPVRSAAAPRAGDSDGAGGLPWLDALAPDRTVYVTFGTVWNRDPAAFRAVVDALAPEALDLVVTVGGSVDRATVDPGRSGVHVAAFIPQAQVLPRCAAVVCHGGAGTVLGALAHGRPVLVLPQAADQFANGERIAAAGAGLTFGAEPPSGRAVRDAVRELLDDPAYRSAAAAVAAEIAAMPEPATAIAAVAGLAR